MSAKASNTNTVFPAGPRKDRMKRGSPMKQRLFDTSIAATFSSLAWAVGVVTTTFALGLVGSRNLISVCLWTG